MAKYFLGSVGEVEAYEVISSISGETTMNLAFTSKSLTDSAVNISVNKEQIIDSYNGAPAGVFYHSPSITISLSDIMWRPEYLESSLGFAFNEMCDEGNIEYYQIEGTTNSAGYFSFSGTNYKRPVKIQMPGVSAEDSPYVVMGRLQGENEWYTYNYDSATGYIGYDPSIPSRGSTTGVLAPNATYCFRYPVTSSQSRLMQLTTHILPKELFLVITTPLFAAEACDSNFEGSQNLPEDLMVSTGKKVGKLVYEVPRWALDGDTSFSFSMSSNSGMQLSGTVLESIDNEEEPTYMRIREFIKTRVWYEGLVDIVWDGTWASSSSGVDYGGHIYGVYADGSYEALISSKDDIRFVIKPTVGTTWSCTNDNKYTYNGITYNVTGKFNVFDGTAAVYPAVLWEDENHEEILLILTDMNIIIDSGG